MLLILLALGACGTSTTKVVKILETNEKVALSNLDNYSIGDTVVVTAGRYGWDVDRQWIKFDDSKWCSNYTTQCYYKAVIVK